ncbi:glycosyltransferase family 2 protein [Leuconostoc citreum]|uniref:glycosyltransferase family 2 protein n=1 Tax=Leuconostoc citreum TaxID=33964 RepID=UPI0021A5CC50|nr:glycosyltransferase family 2 protein [Leuconostoc citreum]MCT3076263.1 glycosyltransferase [Leuconostoc citreum]
MISVIIPVYNSESTLKKLINQLIGQSSRNFEVIFVDDGSKDNSRKIINSIPGDSLSYQYIYTMNRGVSSARNEGISRAKGQYIMFVDPDDEIDNQFIEIGLKLIRKSDLGIMGFDQRDANTRKILATNLWNKDESFDFSVFLEHFGELYNLELLFSLWNKVYSLDIIVDKKLKFSDIRMGEDFLFNMQYFNFIKKIKITSEVQYHYLRYSTGTATTSYNGDEFQCNYNNQKYMINFLHKYDIYDEKLVSLHWALILAYRFSDIRKLRRSDKTNYIKAKKEYLKILDLYQNEKLVKSKYLPFFRLVKYFIMTTTLNRLFI